MSAVRRVAKRVMRKFESFTDAPVLRPLAKYLEHPALWAINRRSVALAVAAGLFSGLIPGPMQVLGAALLAIWLKFNLPIAVVITLYTNPFTIVPLYLLAYQIGAWALGAPPVASVGLPPLLDPFNLVASLRGISEWAQGLGTPLLLGVPLLACLLSACGYALVRVLWSAHLRWAWRSRRRQRKKV
jgi:uncharacterized protein